MEEQPYIEKIEVNVEKISLYNPKYGDERVCQCGHPYRRHFDPYEHNEAVGCKYCDCMEFVEAKATDIIPREKLAEIGADIRNKLGPLANLIVLIERYKISENEKEADALWKYIEKEIEQCKISINYIKKLL